MPKLVVIELSVEFDDDSISVVVVYSFESILALMPLELLSSVSMTLLAVAELRKLFARYSLSGSQLSKFSKFEHRGPRGMSVTDGCGSMSLDEHCEGRDLRRLGAFL